MGGRLLNLFYPSGVGIPKAELPTLPAKLQDAETLPVLVQGRADKAPITHARPGSASSERPASLRHLQPLRTATGGSFSKWERGGAAQASEGAR